MASKHGSKSKTRVSAGTTRNIVAALPMIFGMSPDQANRLKNIPKRSLGLFQEGKAVRVDFTNIYLRLVTGIHICKDLFEMTGDAASVYMAIDDAVAVLRAAMTESLSKVPEVCRMSPVTIQLVDDALELINELQNQITRRELNGAWKKAVAAIEERFREMHPGQPIPAQVKDQII